MRKFFILGFVFALSQTWITLAAAADSDLFALPPDAQIKGATDGKLAPVAFKPPTGEQFEARLKQMSDSFKPIDYEPALKAKELGAGLDPSFQFVRDQIRFESYPGVLRGAKGAYIAKAANAADRALLLAGFLQDKGIECRFAIGHLADADCQKLFEQMFAAPQRTAQAEDSTQSGEFAKAVRARALRDFSAIRGALGEHLPTTTVPDRTQLLKEIASHVWVQAKSGDKWIDLDPSFADAQSGKTYCKADQVVTALPAEMFQQATIRVIVETLDGASLKKETLLEMTRPVRELADKQLFVLHVPPAGLAGLGNSAGGKKDAWAPGIWLDGDVVVGKQISLDESRKPAGGAVGDALDALDDKPVAAAAPAIVSETLEFELTAPGAAPQIVRRSLYDRGGPAWRRTAPDTKTLRPLERDENGPVALQAIHNIWLSTGRHSMAEYAGAMGMLLDSVQKAPAEADQTDFNRMAWQIALQNLSCVLWGDQTFLPALNDDPSVRFYVDSPRILMFTISIHKDPAAADNRLIRFEIDLRRDTIRGVAKDAAAAPALVLRKLWYGTLEGALEHETIAVQSVAATEQQSPVASTSALLDKGQTVVLTPSDAAKPWETLSPDKNTAARIAAALQAGETLVVPKDALASADAGWWAISPGTADLRAVGADDLNHGSTDVSGKLVRKAPGSYGGSSGSGTQYYNPKTGGSYTYKQKTAGGNEDATILVTVSIPGAITIRITVTHALVACALAAAACLVWYAVR